MKRILPTLALLVIALPVHAMSLTVLRDRPTLNLPFYHVIDGGSREKTDLPNLVFLLDHPQGLTLIDTGYGSRFEEVTRGFPMSLLYSCIQVGKGPILRDRLKLLGISPAAIKRIVLTHLHLDHVGGVIDFPNAEVVVNRTEWESGRLPEFLRASIGKRLRCVEFSKGTPYEGFDRSLDLFGDGKVVLVETPGHTKGHMSAFVNLPSGKRYLLAGDVAWIEENYRRPVSKGWPMRWILEPDWNDDALRRLHTLAERAPEITIVPFHDPRSDKTLPIPPARCE